MRLNSCCGMEWMATSPHVVSTVTCLSNDILADLSSISGSSICQCKAELRRSRSGVCYGALNYTQQLGPTQNCRQGCPSGQRFYQTGSSLSCNDSSFAPSKSIPNDFTLFETSCQGPVSVDLLLSMIHITYYVLP